MPHRMEMHDENADPSCGLQSLRVKAIPVQDLVAMLNKHRGTLREVQVSMNPPPNITEETWSKDFHDVHNALQGCALLWSVLLDRLYEDRCGPACPAQVMALARKLPSCNIQCTNCGAAAP